MTDPARRESTAGLLVEAAVAFLRAWVGAVPAPIIGAALTVCGLVLILSPLALWVAWSTTVFQIVLTLALSALALAIALVKLAREEQL